jgi:hypothetical protein
LTSPRGSESKVSRFQYRPENPAYKLAPTRSAAKERGFRSEQAFILAPCKNELERGDSTEATDQLEARIAATLANTRKQVQSLFTLVHAQFAITNSLLQYVLCPDDFAIGGFEASKHELHSINGELG